MSGNHRKGYHRVRMIKEAVERHGVLDTYMVELLFYSKRKDSLRAAQDRLQKMHKKGLLNRSRESFDQPYYYYQGKRPGQPEHQLGVNWMYLWILSSLKSWESIHSIAYEQDYGQVRTDAFVAIKNAADKARPFKFYFLEFDRAGSGNDFDKVKRYRDLYLSENYLSHWWAPLADRFPAVLVATDTPARARALRKRIHKDVDEYTPEFRVYELDVLRGECYAARHQA